jgi:hypothetical protein
MMRELQQRLEAVSEEIRNYPRPIARCDEQLTALLDERRRLFEELTTNAARDGCTPAAIWVNDGGREEFANAA